jgi:hypothetical protein
MTIGSGTSTATLYNSWGEIETATWGSDGLVSTNGLSMLGEAAGVSGFADDASAAAFPTGNWGHLLGAISYAVDHGYYGARAAFDRLTGASNWTTNAAKFQEYPGYGLAPRAPDQAAPSWYTAQTQNTWKNLGQSFMDGLGSNISVGVEYTTTGPFSYSGGYVNNRGHYDRNGVWRHGASIGIAAGGGHLAYAGNEVVDFWLYTASWARLRDSYGSPPSDPGLNGSDTYADGTPASRHVYSAQVHIPDTQEIFLPVTGARWSNGGASGHASFSFDTSNPAPNAAALGPWTRNTDLPNLEMSGAGLYGVGGMACWDSDNHRVVFLQSGRYKAVYFNPRTRAWDERGEGAGSPWSYTDRGSSCHIPGRNWVVVHLPPSGGGEESGLLVMDMNVTNPTAIQMATSGSPPGASTPQGLAWDTYNGRLVACDKSGNLRVCTPPATIGATWTWTALTNTGGDTPDAQAWSGEGVWTRFGYVDDGVLRGYVLCAGPDTRPCFYKLGVPETGLVFPSNTGVAANTVQMRFTGANLLPAYPATYIFRYRPVQQTGYYTTFFWARGDNVFGGGTDGYYGCHPYPQGGSSGTAHNWEISIEGADKITSDTGVSTVVTKNAWYTQAVTVRVVNGDEIECKFYWDLNDPTKVITYITGNTVNYATKFGVPSPCLVFGDAPWQPGNEALSGTLRGLQIYSTNLSLSDILVEAANGSVNTPQTTAGQASVWYMNQNPTPTDISDKSGEGHNPAWYNANRPTLYTG